MIRPALAVIVLILAWSLESRACDSYPATVERIVDGDTMDVMIEVFPASFRRERIRLAGINTAEKRTRRECEAADAAAAVAYVLDWTTAHEGAIRLVLRGKGGFGRTLGELIADGESLGGELLRRGLAVPYRKGGSKNWRCRK